jgi:hypothetical protein
MRMLEDSLRDGFGFLNGAARRLRTAFRIPDLAWRAGGEGDGREIEALRDLLVASGFHVCLRGRTELRLPTGMAVAFRA